MWQAGPSPKKMCYCVLTEKTSIYLSIYLSIYIYVCLQKWGWIFLPGYLKIYPSIGLGVLPQHHKVVYPIHIHSRQWWIHGAQGHRGTGELLHFQDLLSVHEGGTRDLRDAHLAAPQITHSFWRDDPPSKPSIFWGSSISGFSQKSIKGYQRSKAQKWYASPPQAHLSSIPSSHHPIIPSIDAPAFSRNFFTSTSMTSVSPGTTGFLNFTWAPGKPWTMRGDGDFAKPGEFTSRKNGDFSSKKSMI